MSIERDSDHNIDTQNIPHSGEYGYEQPVEHFDNTTLSQAHEAGYIQTPEDASALVTPESTKRHSRRNRFIAAGAGLAVLAAGFAGFELAKSGNSIDKALPKDPKATSEPTPASTHEVAPTTKPTEAPSAVSTPEAPVVASPIEKYQNMSEDDFLHLPKSEQLTYWASLVGGMDGIKQFAAENYRVSQDPYDKLPEEISTSNTPQEIEAVITYGDRLPFSLTGEDRRKATIAVLNDDRGSVEWDQLSNALQKDPEGMTAGAIAYEGIVPQVHPVTGSELKTDSIGNTYRDLHYTDKNGNTTSLTVYFETVKYNGQEFGWWITQ